MRKDKTRYLTEWAITRCPAICGPDPKVVGAPPDDHSSGGLQPLINDLNVALGLACEQPVMQPLTTPEIATSFIRQ